MGAGTTALVARQHSRDYVGIELNPEYAMMAQRRLVEKIGFIGRVVDFSKWKQRKEGGKQCA
jgi:DNA modification methylase